MWKRRRNTRTKSLPKTALLLLVMCLPLSVQAVEPVKSVSLTEALDIAMQHHPRLKMANADIERDRAGKGEVWDGGSTSLSYSWGQLNDIYCKDHEISIEQSLGSPLTPVYKNALVNTRVEKDEHYRDMVKKEIVAEVKRAWFYYQYACQVKSLYDEQEALSKKLRESGDLRYRQGDIDLTERNMIAATASDIHTRWMQASGEVQLAARRFTWACYAQEEIVPQDTLLTVLPFHEKRMPLSQNHLDFFSAQVKEKKDLLRIERSKFFPEFSFGYVQQKIYY